MNESTFPYLENITPNKFIRTPSVKIILRTITHYESRRRDIDGSNRIPKLVDQLLFIAEPSQVEFLAVSIK